MILYELRYFFQAEKYTSAEAFYVNPILIVHILIKITNLARSLVTPRSRQDPPLQLINFQCIATHSSNELQTLTNNCLTKNMNHTRTSWNEMRFTSSLFNRITVQKLNRFQKYR